jgi:pimeloyl-ACP methyl ester carboxylesterase
VYYEDITANAWDSGSGDWGGPNSAHDDWTGATCATVPTGVLVSTTRDITIRRFAEREHNVVHWSEYDQGGHFFAMEQPRLFVADVRDFFRTVR